MLIFVTNSIIDRLSQNMKAIDLFFDFFGSILFFLFSFLVVSLFDVKWNIEKFFWFGYFFEENNQCGSRGVRWKVFENIKNFGTEESQGF